MFTLTKSARKDKKWKVTPPVGSPIHFGATGYSDFTIHKDEKRKKSYIARHLPNEYWDANGIATAGFWSRWLLWNKPTIQESIRDIENKFNIRIRQ